MVNKQKLSRKSSVTSFHGKHLKGQNDIKNVMVDHAGFIFVLFFGIHSKERKQGDQM